MFENELSTVPLNPPRTGVLPGMRLGNAIPRSTYLVLFAFIVFFAAFPLTMMTADPTMKLGLGPSRTAEGHMLAVSDANGCRNSGSRQVVYAFVSESGHEFRGTSTLCQASPYYSAQPGDKIEVRYLVRDPSVNAVVGSNADNQPPLFPFLIFPLFFLLIFSPLYLPQLREVLRARRLYKTAALVQGQVVFVKRRNIGSWPGWPGTSSADVFVGYQLPGSGPAETLVSCSNEWLINKLSPGTPVHILLARDKAERGVLLEAYIR